MTRNSLNPIACALLGCCLAAGAHAGSACDPDLLDEASSPLAYQDRGDRCEGLYAQMVSSLNLEIRSLVGAFEPFDPAAHGELVVEWTPPPGAGGRQLHLRAFSLKPRTFYRMDAAVPASRGSFRWPTGVLESLGLTREDLGIVGWLPPAPGDALGEETYLPLRISPAAGAASGAYHLALVPARRLESVRVTLEKLGEAGAPVATLRRGEELGYGYYPSNVPTVFPIEGLDGEGLYRLEIAVEDRGGSSTATADIIFYHPPAGAN